MWNWRVCVCVFILLDTRNPKLFVLQIESYIVFGYTFVLIVLIVVLSHLFLFPSLFVSIIVSFFFYSLQVFFFCFFPINNSYNTIRLLYIHIASVAQYTRDNVWLKGGKHNKNIGIYLSIYPPLLKSTHTTYITKCKQAT